MSVQQLPHGVIKLISSTQVISSVSSVVKELVENSIDAGASVIDIKLVRSISFLYFTLISVLFCFPLGFLFQEKTGLEKIEIRDNGCGIAKADALNVCLSNYTSKIYSFDDLGMYSRSCVNSTVVLKTTAVQFFFFITLNSNLITLN